MGLCWFRISTLSNPNQAVWQLYDCMPEVLNWATCISCGTDRTLLIIVVIHMPKLSMIRVASRDQLLNEDTLIWLKIYQTTFMIVFRSALRDVCQISRERLYWERSKVSLTACYDSRIFLFEFCSSLKNVNRHFQNEVYYKMSIMWPGIHQAIKQHS